MQPRYFLRIILLLSVLSIVTNSNAQTAFSDDVVYANPKHNSFYNSASTNILLRFKEVIVLDSEAIKSSITILDNNTPISYNIVFLSDLKTIILNPVISFSNNSQVEVQVDNNLKYLNNNSINGFSFWFKTLNDNNGQKSIRISNEFPEFIHTKNTVTDFDTSTALINRIKNQNTVNVFANNGNTSGYYFISTIATNPNDQNRLLILNTNGEIIYEKLTSGYALDFKKLNETTYSFYNTDLKCYFLMDTNFNVTNQIVAGNGYATDNHEIQYDKKTGNYIILAYEFVNVNMVDSIVGGSTNASVLGNIIQEIDKDNNVVFEWKTLDYLPITAAKGVDLRSNNIDYVHSNAVEIDNDSNLLLSSRHLNEIEKIDRNNGNLMWRFGLNSSNNDFLFIGDTIGFTYQHDIRRLPNGNVTLFDNGNLRPGVIKYSRALEYKLNEELMTAELVWQYRNSPDVYTQFMGNVQRNLNGNTVIGWGGSPVRTFTEIDKKDNKLFEIFVPNIYNYRAFNYGTSSIVPSNLINLVNPTQLTYCNEDSLQVKSNLQNVLIPSNIREKADLTSSIEVRSDTVNVYVKSANNFFAKTQTIIDYKYSQLDQNDTVICKGNEMFIKLNEACLNATYRWSNNDSNASTFIKPDSTNYYWVDISNGNYKRRDSILVEVSSIPFMNILGSRTFTQPYSVFTYSLPNNSNYRYQWSVNNGNIIQNPEINNAVQVQLDGAKSAELNVVITNYYGCVSNESIAISYVGEETSVHQALNAKDILIYPNPTNGIINITAPKNFTYKNNRYYR
ncbi:MAG: aryl-sulfate sulfotransferase [Bacteroidia bacterium]